MGKHTNNYQAKDSPFDCQHRKDKNRKKYQATLNNFLTKLQKQSTATDSDTILQKIHRFVKKQKKISRNINLKPIKQKLKICKKCDRWNMSKQIIQCGVCEDYYHKQCWSTTQEKQTVCLSCRKTDQVKKQCKKCHQKSSSLARCRICNFWFHPQCLQTKEMKCKKCHGIQKQVKKLQRQPTLQQFQCSKSIKIQQKTDQSASKNQINKYQAKFIYNQLIPHQKDINRYKLDLLQAIRKKKMVYTQQLINMEDHMDKVFQNSLDFGMSFMNKAQIDAYKEYKKQPIGPFKIDFLQQKGFDVVADRQIPAKSLICEYIGEIVTHRQCIYLQNINKNDSLMELKSGKNCEETLIIRPQKYTNIARFINGTKKNGSNQNIHTIRMLYKRMPVVLLVSSRIIKKGQSLAYDYNAGGIQAQYDTSHFV